MTMTDEHPYLLDGTFWSEGISMMIIFVCGVIQMNVAPQDFNRIKITWFTQL